MDNKKFEQLIDLIINENEEQARELFHDIVVEKSREIYESIMAEEMMDETDEMAGEVGDLMDEIESEEAGVVEGEDEEGEEADIEGDDDAEDLDMEFDADEEGEEEGEEVEDAVVRIEDKLDQLMAEFEQLMGNDEAEGEEDFGGEEDLGGEEAPEEMMESTDLQKVAVPTGGDDGDNKKSVVADNSGKAGMEGDPVSFAGGDEKGGKVAAPKEVGGNFKNSAGQKTVDLEAAPKAKVAESKKSVKKIIK